MNVDHPCTSIAICPPKHMLCWISMECVQYYVLASTCQLSSCVFVHVCVNFGYNTLHILCCISHVLAMTAAMSRSQCQVFGQWTCIKVHTSAPHKDLVELCLCPTAVTLQYPLIL